MDEDWRIRHTQEDSSQLPQERRQSESRIYSPEESLLSRMRPVSLSGSPGPRTNSVFSNPGAQLFDPDARLQAGQSRAHHQAQIPPMPVPSIRILNPTLGDRDISATPKPVQSESF
jgi:hypothetical protein